MSSQVYKLLFGQDQLGNMIALYESYVTNIEASLITQREMTQKGQSFLQWVNDLLASKIKKINQIAQHSIDVFRHLEDEQISISNKIVELQHQNVEKSTTIQNHLYTIKNLSNKLTQRENDIDKLRLQIGQLTEKIDKQQSKFKRQAKQFKKTFRIIQQNTESDKQIFDSIQLQYQYERSQKDIMKNDLQIIKEQHLALKNQFNQTKRILKASQNKLQWEVKKKISLQEVIKQKNQMIQKLLMEIGDLKQTLKQSDGGIDSQHLHEKYFDDGQHPHTMVKSLSKNILSQQMAFRQSFSSEMDMDEEFVRKNSLRKSFDEGSVNVLQGQYDYTINNGEQGISQYGNKRSLYDQGNSNIHSSGYLKSRSNKSSFYHQDQYNNTIKEESSSKVSSNQKLSVNRSPSPKSIHIKQHQYENNSSSPLNYDQNGTMSMRRRSPSDTSSPEIHRFEPSPPNQNSHLQKDQIHNQQDELQIITQKVQSNSTQKSIQIQQQPANQNLQSFRRCVPDLYFAHFLLTSQSVKIKQDCEQMLNIDVKQYYGQVVQKRVPMHIWDDWIREKLRIAVKVIKEKYQSQRRASINSNKK